MSSEQSITKSLETTIVNNDIKTIDKNHNKVDINDLLLKLRTKEKLQKKENLLFFGIIGLIIIIIGIIASV